MALNRKKLFFSFISLLLTGIIIFANGLWVIFMYYSSNYQQNINIMRIVIKKALESSTEVLAAKGSISIDG
jgi:hypothetical protein